MGKHRLMQDPFYAQILFAIERRIQLADVAAAKRGVVFTDSLVRSALVQAANTAKGRPPAPVPATAPAKERLPAELAAEILQARNDLQIVEPAADGSEAVKPLPTNEWVDSLQAVRESCALRGDGQAGSRAYLDYLREFMAEAFKAKRTAAN